MHALLAVAFLSVMLVEWGAHSLAFAHAAPAIGLIVITGSEIEHDDPCRTTVCCESRKNDQKAPGFAHDLFPCGSVLDRPFGESQISLLAEEPPFIKQPADRIFRPKDPLLHPPEYS